MITKSLTITFTCQSSVNMSYFLEEWPWTTGEVVQLSWSMLL